MGRLLYGSSAPPVELDDRLLQYIQIITATKLRRNESFAMTVVRDDALGRETLWMQPAIPLRFVFTHAEAGAVERGYLQQLAQAASSAAGLTIDPHDWETQEAAHRASLTPAA